MAAAPAATPAGRPARCTAMPPRHAAKPGRPDGCGRERSVSPAYDRTVALLACKRGPDAPITMASSDSPLTHFDPQGQAHMVDVSAKAETHRVARARGS